MNYIMFHVVWQILEWTPKNIWCKDFLGLDTSKFIYDDCCDGICLNLWNCWWNGFPKGMGDIDKYHESLPYVTKMSCWYGFNCWWDWMGTIEILVERMMFHHWEINCIIASTVRSLWSLSNIMICLDGCRQCLRSCYQLLQNWNSLVWQELKFQQKIEAIKSIEP